MFQFQSRGHGLSIQIATFALNVLPNTSNEGEGESATNSYVSFDVLEDVFAFLSAPRTSAAEKTLIEYFTSPPCNVMSSKLYFSYPEQPILELQPPPSSLGNENKALLFVYYYDCGDGEGSDDRVCASYRTAPALSTEDASAFVVDENGTVHGVSTGWESN
eukprot:PhM_4_TR3411/c4_g2_i3/m.82432